MFKRFFMNKSLKSRITFLYTIFAVVVIGAITFYAYYFTVNLLKEKENAILNDSIEYLERQISARIEDINEEYINNFENDNFLELYLRSTEKRYSLAEKTKLNNELKNYFFDIKVRNTDLIESIYLVSDGGNVYSDEYNDRFGYNIYSESPYYDEVMENKNKIMYRNLEPDSECFSIIRSFYFMDNESGSTKYPSVGYTSENNEDYSTLIFFLKKSYLQEMIEEEAESRQTSILILDQDKNVVVQEGNLEWLSEEERIMFIEQAKEHSSGNFESQLKKRVGIHIRTIEIMDWEIVYIYDMNILYRQAGEIQKVALLVFALAFLAVILIASFISRTVVEPIQILAKSMDEAVENNMEVSFKPKYNDEIADLGNRFTMLMKRVSGLMIEVKHVEEQKRLEEFKALQAQINPHFLYNTLDMVYWLAKMEKNDNVADIVADLADFFRLSLNQGEDITTVKREIEHVRKYLEIQKMRRDSQFDYKICMDEQISDKKIPKLILQPFIENTLIHGFENLSYQGVIEITVSRKEENIVFWISDNGSGIESDLLEKLNSDMISKDGNKGYAIGNVRDRMRLYAGNESGVCFETNVEKGTKVHIWFPCEFEEDK